MISSSRFLCEGVRGGDKILERKIFPLKKKMNIKMLLRQTEQALKLALITLVNVIDSHVKSHRMRTQRSLISLLVPR